MINILDEKEMLAMLSLPTPVLPIFGDVTDEMANRIIQSCTGLRLRNSPDLEVHIHSEGGEFQPALHVYDALREYSRRAHVRGVVLGEASSGAAVILQACTVRQSRPHGNILIHDVTDTGVSASALRSKKKRAELVQSSMALQSMLEKLLSRHTGQTIRTIRMQCEKDEIMTAKEALAFGLIDGITTRY